TLPLKKVSLLTSGVGYFEHAGNINGGAETVISLSFPVAAMDDALKSLVVRDPRGSGVQVRYPSENYMWTALEDLAVDLRGWPDVTEILRRNQGAEVTIVSSLQPFTKAGPAQGGPDESGDQTTTTSGVLLSANNETLSVYDGGIHVVWTAALRSVSFTDPRLNEDLRKALAVISENRNSAARRVSVALEGNGARDVRLSYVIPAAVWKASYRLDLSGQTPFLQAWAIVDNDSGSDWENTELTLVSGRPVSFVQQLYQPYRLLRPVKPLEIAGAAEAQVYGGAMMQEMAVADTASGRNDALSARSMTYREKGEPQAEASFAAASAPVAPSPMERGGSYASSAAADSGFLFEWTFKEPVTVMRGQSVMLPLTEGAVEARKVLIFNGRAASAQGTHPQIGVELVNTTGQQLPPGPVTVFDNSSYAGDALVSFLGAGEKRLLSYADDLSVSGSVSNNSRRVVSAVKISGGVMTITRKASFELTYTFNNTSPEEKTVIIEHPVRFNAELAVPEKADERTDSVYRFSQTLPARRSVPFQVVEEIPQSERLSLTGMSIDSFVSYASNVEIPQNVRTALQRAVALREAANAAATRLNEIDGELQRASAEQSRVRDNLTAVGTDTPAGAQYLERLQEIDTRIDTMNADYDKALAASRTATGAYNEYIAGLEL
ncbi:MAG: DUF4139 domain-containing protein, partial [Spirochaetaceae bacterium]|nr:DUF4139 domain-containing protein [Spirochaetaceae bacterium]